MTQINFILLGLLLLLFSVVAVRAIFLLGRNIIFRRNAERHDRGTISARLGFTNCPECRGEMGVEKEACPHCAHDVAEFNQGHAAAAIELLQRRVASHARLKWIEGIVVYVAFAVFGTGVIIFGILAGSWLSIVAGVLTLAVEGFGYWLDKEKAPKPLHSKV